VAASTAANITRVLGPERSRAPAGRETRAAQVVIEPRSVDEVAELVRACEADRIALAPLGAAATLGEIRRAPAAVGVSLARMARIVAHEPADMTVIAEAGLTLGALNNALAGSRQRLPLDPRDPQMRTVGAVVAASQAGPLRLSEGGARDLLIGIHFVSSGGRLVRAGGRVVKNVAGYDLMKVMTGSFGTLGIIVETTFKVRPLPERYALALRACESAAAAFDAARRLHDALPLAHLEVLSPAHAAGLGFADRHLLLAGFSGNQRELACQRETIARIAGSGAEFLDGDGAARSYAELRDLDTASGALAAQVAVPPAELARALETSGAEFRAHAGSGVAQIATADVSGADAARATLARWRDGAHGMRGHVRVLAAAPEFRAALDFFDSPGAGALKLMRRMKTAFDSAGIFNPGCFVGGL
jgi:glycolate dehydrogenase FAD-binding subunit